MRTREASSLVPTSDNLTWTCTATAGATYLNASGITGNV